MPASQHRSLLDFGGDLRVSLACIEYRIQWDDAAQSWDVLRNGVARNAPNMRAAAVAVAIRDAKAEFKASNSTVFVTCLEGRSLETLWRGTQLSMGVK